MKRIICSFLLITVQNILPLSNLELSQLPTVHIVQINNNTKDGYVFNKILEPSQAKSQNMYVAQEDKIIIPGNQTVQNPNFGKIGFNYNYKQTAGVSKRSLIDVDKGTTYKFHVTQTLKYDNSGIDIIGKSVIITLIDHQGNPVARMGTTLPPQQFKKNSIYIALTLNRPISTSKIALVGVTPTEALPTTAVDY